MITVKKRALDVVPGDVIVGPGGQLVTVRSRAMHLTPGRFMMELEAVGRNEASYVTFSHDDMVDVRPAAPVRTDEELALAMLDAIRLQGLYVRAGDPLHGQEIDGHVDLVALARDIRAWLRGVNL